MTLDRGAYRFSGASQEFKDHIRELEQRIDAWVEDVRLTKFPWSRTAYAILTRIMDIIENDVIPTHGFGGPRHNEALMNLGIIGAHALSGLRTHCEITREADLRWGIMTRENAAQALAVAGSYWPFTLLLPMWYRDRSTVEMKSSLHLRFVAIGNSRDRQVSAYQKGTRREAFKRPPSESVAPLSLTEVEETYFGDLLQSVRTIDKFRIDYALPAALLERITERYANNLRQAFRRSESISLGKYDLLQFTQVYAALMAVAGVHDLLCYRIGNITGVYPVMSAVVAWSTARWIETLCSLSHQPSETAKAIVDDLTLGTTRLLDLHVHPFVSLRDNSQVLLLSPGFPLHSRADENILRVCSQIRKAAYDAASLLKEDEFRNDLKDAGASRLGAVGPIRLPAPHPDIDLLLVDETNACIAICELKWIRKPFTALERFDRDHEFHKGILQLQRIKTFLISNPHYLRTRGSLARSITDYGSVSYILMARDHYLWFEPEKDIFAVEFEAIYAALQQQLDLPSLISSLRSFDWLPVEGSDFVISFDTITCRSVSADSERVLAAR